MFGFLSTAFDYSGYIHALGSNLLEARNDNEKYRNPFDTETLPNVLLIKSREQGDEFGKFDS